MKLKTNFIVPPGTWVLPISAFCLISVLGLGLLNAELMLQREEMASALTVLRNDLGRLRIKNQELNTPTLPEAQTILHIKKRIATMNAILMSSGRPFREMLALLESTLPEQAKLNHLSFEREKGRFQLTLEMPQVKILQKFLHRLKNTGVISEIEVIQQQEIKFSNYKVLRTELRFREKRETETGKGEMQ